MHLQRYFYRSADSILNTRPLIQDEVDKALLDLSLDFPSLSRAYFNDLLKQNFFHAGWEHHPSRLHEPVDPFSKIELIKQNVGLELGFRHTSLIGHNLIKFQLSSAHNSDRIDVGIYVTTTRNFQKFLKKEYNHNWAGAMYFEKVERYLRHFTSTILMPIYLVGLDVV